jgi:hypothetical protein
MADACGATGRSVTMNGRSNPDPRLLHFKAPAAVLGIEPDARRALIVAATDAPVFKGGSWMSYEMTHEACDTTLLNSGKSPLLDSHGYGLQALLGVVECAWLEANEDQRTELRCIARFSRNPPGAAAWRDVHDGILLYASIGAEAQTAKVVGDTHVIQRWRPFEVSLCALPANRECTIEFSADDLAGRVLRQKAEQTTFRDLRMREVLRAKAWEAWAPETARAIAAETGTDAEAVGALLRRHVDAHISRLTAAQ